MQYYGYPVQAARTVGHENSRISYQQFAFIILGCVFAVWNEFGVTNDEGIRRIDRLASVFDASFKDKFDHSNHPTWFIYLAVAA